MVHPRRLSTATSECTPALSIIVSCGIRDADVHLTVRLCDAPQGGPNVLAPAAAVHDTKVVRSGMPMSSSRSICAMRH